MEKETVTIDLGDVREVTMRELSITHVNPFAVKLIAESFKEHPDPKPMTFKYGGVLIHLRPAK